MARAERDAVLAAGRAAFAAFQLHELERVGSTQDVVRAAAAAGAPAGYCVVAGAQDAGRGRQGRTWVARPGAALLVSVLVEVAPDVAPGTAIAAGLAVRAAIAGLGVDARLKWPNDVLAGGRKLAGILCEIEPRAAPGRVAVAVGVGVNLGREASTVVGATDLERETGAAASPGRVLAALLTELGRRLATLAAGGVPALRDEWTASAWGLGEPVTAQSGSTTVRGIARGLADDGALLVADGDTVHRLVAGDVHVGLPGGSPGEAPPSR